MIMSPTHFHLAAVHVPVIGFPILLLLLIAGTLFKRSELQTAAFVGFVLIALTTIPVYLSGESAEEVAEHLPGVTEEQIELHESAAGTALPAVLITGSFCLLTLLLHRLRPSWAKPFFTASFVLSIISSAILAWTANEGGKIRHTEIRESSSDVGMTPHDDD